MSDGPIGNDSNTVDLVKALEQRARRRQRELQPDKPKNRPASHLRGPVEEDRADALKRVRVDDKFQALLRAAHSDLEGKEPTIAGDTRHTFHRPVTVRSTGFM